MQVTLTSALINSSEELSRDPKFIPCNLYNNLFSVLNNVLLILILGMYQRRIPYETDKFPGIIIFFLRTVSVNTKSNIEIYQYNMILWHVAFTIFIRNKQDWIKNYVNSNKMLPDVWNLQLPVISLNLYNAKIYMFVSPDLTLPISSRKKWKVNIRLSSVYHGISSRFS